MSKEFPLGLEVIARPNQPLVSHLRNTAEIAYHRALGIGLPPEMATAVKRTGLGHDLGKVADDVQLKLHGLEVNKAPHAPDGARFMADLGYLIEGFLGFRHHGGLSEDLAPDSWPERSLSMHRVESWAKESGVQAEIEALPCRVLLTQIREWVKDHQLTPDDATSVVTRHRRGMDFYYLLRLLLGCLVYADHTDSASVENGPDLKASLPYKAKENLANVGTHLENVRLERRATTDKALLELRDAVQAACMKPWPDGKRIAVLTAPTGCGKTLASLLSAFTINGVDQCVYVAPLLAVTDQAHGLFHDLGIDVLVHTSVHRIFKDEEEPESERLGSKARDTASRKNGWDHPFIETTTERLSRVLVGKATSDVKRMLVLSKPSTLVVIDEIQYIPPIKLRVYLRLLYRLGCKVLLMSATTTMTKVVLEQEELPYYNMGDFKQVRSFRRFKWLGTSEKNGPSMDSIGKQVLAGYNTVARAKMAWQQSKYPDEAFIYTSHQCPKHREAILAAVTTRLKECLPVRLAATQAIWTGKDISFPQGLLQLAPADGVTQFKGRINREGAKDGSGDITLWHNFKAFAAGGDTDLPYCPADEDYRDATDRLAKAIKSRRLPEWDDFVMQELYDQIATEMAQENYQKEISGADVTLTHAFTSERNGRRTSLPVPKNVRCLTLIPPRENEALVFVNYAGALQKIRKGQLRWDEALQYGVNIRIPSDKNPFYAKVMDSIQECQIQFKNEKEPRTVELWLGSYHPIFGIDF